MIEGTYQEISQDSALFIFNGVQYEPKHFFHHGKKTGFTDELLKFANDSYEKWGSSGLLLTADIPNCWKGMTDKQKGMIYPKLGIMWTSLDTFDDYIPPWIDTIAGYRPIVKQITSTKVILLKDEYLDYYFQIPNVVVELEKSTGTTIHIYCPHCGKKIF